MHTQDIGQTAEVTALTTAKGREPFEFTGELLAWASKRTEGRFGDNSPTATLRLYKNVSERVKPARRYVLAFEKTEADGMLIVASYKTFPSLEKMAEKSPVDKMHRRICELAGVRDYMDDMKPAELGGQRTGRGAEAG